MKILVKLVECFSLRMRTGKARNIADEKASLNTFLYYCREVVHTSDYAAAAPASSRFQRVALKSSTASFIWAFRLSSMDFFSRIVFITPG